MCENMQSQINKMQDLVSAEKRTRQETLSTLERLIEGMKRDLLREMAVERK